MSETPKSRQSVPVHGHLNGKVLPRVQVELIGICKNKTKGCVPSHSIVNSMDNTYSENQIRIN